MEAIGAGAGVVAFITLGLKSAKKIHEFVGYINDGDKQVEDAKRAVESLMLSLERLSICRMVGEPGLGGQAFAARIMVCADEMKTFAEELDTLAMKDTQRFLGRQWKRVKLVLNEKRLKKMGAAVLGHTTALDLHLAGLGSDMLFETRESLAARIDQQSGSIRNSITQGRTSLEQANDQQRTCIQQSITQNGISLQQAIDSQGAYLQHTIVEQKVSIEESIDRQATSFQQTIGQHAIWQQQAIEREGVLIRQAVSKSESRLIEQQAASTVTLRDDLAQVCKEVVQVSKEVTNVRDEAKRLREEFQAEKVASTAREDLIMRKLNQLLEKVQLYAPRVDEFDNNPDSEDIVPHTELTESLGWLLEALREKRGIFGRDEARDAVDALAGFLERMCSYLSTNSAAADASKSRHWDDISAPSDIAGLRENLKSLQGIILCARSVSLNVNNIKRKRPVETDLATKRLKMTRIELPVGTVLVTSTRTVCLAAAPPTPISPHEPMPVEAPSEQNETRISYFPRLARGSSSKHVGYVHGFHTVVEQCHDYQTGGTFNSIPRLSINRVLPADSPVFSVVLEGDLREFQRMLWDGTASLRDHDEYGAPLLFYANAQPEICRFLLDHGADLDQVASIYGRSQGDLHFTVSALYLDVKQRNVRDDEVSCTLACRRMLIDAGCDPTLPVLDDIDPGENIDGGSILFRDFDCGIQESITIILNSPFINVETILHQDNETPLLALCTGDVSARWKLEGISVLIDRGANILARDSHGRNCLHLVVECVNALMHSPFELEASRRLYEYLLQNGADPYAIDDEKRSVSDVAYNPEYTFGVNSPAGHLWNAALAGSGFCVAQFRQGRARRAHYGFYRGAESRYTRLEFEKLWLGREHLCPYYYDEEPQVIEVDSDTERGADSDYWDALDSGTWVAEEESDLEMGADSEDYDSSDSEDGGGRL